ncbi:MAG TPA: DsbA family protein [Microlunatus sp.]|nr:DsbA family protein [Microlunatus sp.]
MAIPVDFWFDPGCPLTWRTSRWLSEVAARRQLEISWHLMSLWELDQHRDLGPESRDQHEALRRVGLVLEAVRQEYGNDNLGAAYTSIGTRLHDSNQHPDEGTIAAALADEGLPHRLIEHSRSEQIAEAIRISHQRSQTLVGEETRSPVLSVDGGPGFYGPIVVPAPTGEEADQLFDAVVLLSQVPAFSELKRSRRPL